MYFHINIKPNLLCAEFSFSIYSVLICLGMAYIYNSDQIMWFENIGFLFVKAFKNDTYIYIVPLFDILNFLVRLSVCFQTFQPVILSSAFCC